MHNVTIADETPKTACWRHSRMTAETQERSSVNDSGLLCEKRSYCWNELVDLLASRLRTQGLI